MNKTIKIAWQRVLRAPYQSLSAISIMSMSLFLAGVFLCVAFGSQLILQFFESRPQVNAYFKTEYSPVESEVGQLISTLQNSSKISQVKYISKSQALEIYKEMNKTDPLLIEAVTAEMLPASIEVSVKKPGDLKEVAENLKKIPNIEDVRYEENIVNQLVKWTDSVRKIGLVFVSVNTLITFLVIILIIGLKVSNRRVEIGIMQLVGATGGYIVTPFIVEGIIYGLIGATLAFIVLMGIIYSSSAFLSGFLAGIIPLPPPLVWLLELYSILSGLGTFVGGFGGLIAARRFLRS